jgi:hypothetical protein
MTYAQVFAFLLSLSSRLPAILEWIEAGMELFSPEIETLSLVELTDEESALEGQLVTALSADNALFDGSRLRQIVTFIKDNPELVALIKSFLKG